MIQTTNLGDNKNLFVVSVILIAGIGGLTLTIGQVTITSIACALILGVLVNVVVNLVKTKKVAGILLECVQGEGGVIALDKEFAIDFYNYYISKAGDGWQFIEKDDLSFYKLNKKGLVLNVNEVVQL